MGKYKAVKVNGVKHDYHRLLMEQLLGRKLERDEVVHHINGNSLDNDINNLCVMSSSEHSRLHATGRKASPETLEKMRLVQLGNPYGPPRKLTEEQVRFVRDNYKPRDTEFGARALADRFGICHSEISRIVNRKSYRDID